MTAPREKPFAKIRSDLLEWYKRHKRDLPWRRTRDSYSIWLSEVMLQQTRVDTVIPYYEKFLTKFPTLSHLAKADEQQVLKAWEGLGYYSRARNLHFAAKEVAASYGGKLPETAEKLRALKGFGPYTSASVASIAFGEPIACVDGNVTRVLSRIFATDKGISDLAQSLVDTKDPSSFNQAMMELGALICLPRNPKCLICPVRTSCVAAESGSVDLFPARKERKKPAVIHSTSVVLGWKGKVFIRQRPGSGRWAGMWEFPTFESGESETPSAFIKKALKEGHHVQIGPLRPLGKLTHQLTHQTIHVSAFTAQAPDPKKSIGGRWADPAELPKFPLSRLQQRVVSLMLTQTEK